MRKSQQEKIVSQLCESVETIYNLLNELKTDCGDRLDYNFSEENHQAIYEMWEFAHRAIEIYDELEIDQLMYM